MANYKPTREDQGKFWDKVQKGPLCWEWMVSLDLMGRVR
jgi:hypothetical protein